jgi:hypothetical protein
VAGIGVPDGLIVAEAVLFAGLESVSVAVTDALLVIGEAPLTVTDRAMMAVAPFASVGIVHVTVEVPLHDPADGVAET